MADFKNHWRFGLFSSTLTATALSWFKLYDVKLLPLLVMIGWTGSIIPDIDSDTSRPRKLIFDGLCLLLPPALIYRIPLLHSHPLYAVGAWVLMTLIILKPVKWCFRKFSTHRGVFHSIPAAFIYGMGCTLLAVHESAPKLLQLSILIVGVVGFLTHLILDELWAVDFNGKLPSRKRSFGTALTWGGRKTWANYLLYISLVISCRAYWASWYNEPFLPELFSITLEAWGGAIYELFQGQ